MNDEEVLTGGKINSVTRRGNVVYRTGGPWVPAVHAVLDHLARRGFRSSPRALGVDGQGREMISFLPGESMTRPWQPVMFMDDALVQAATMLRELHDATRDLILPPETEWRGDKAGKTAGEVIRHGDLGPWNTLWQGRRLTGLIDWDFAEPGLAITDLAQLALYFVPLRGDQHVRECGFPRQPDFEHRIEVVCAAYGLFGAAEIVREIVRLQEAAMAEIVERAAEGRYPWIAFRDNGEVERTQAEVDWLWETLPDLFNETPPVRDGPDTIEGTR